VLEIPSATWYTDFFTELPNEFWRRAVPPEDTVAEVDFLAEHLGLPPGSRILDVPCGSGRHTPELAARGHRVTGVDISAEAIGHARRAAARARLDVDFVLAEMRTIPRDGSFDAALCLGNSFGYLELAGLREFIAALGEAIRPGGGPSPSTSRRRPNPSCPGSPAGRGPCGPVTSRSLPRTATTSAGAA
jgi:cyclopropane fatty-acyl-phospholipid synthase-like methyltransferase